MSSSDLYWGKSRKELRHCEDVCLQDCYLFFFRLLKFFFLFLESGQGKLTTYHPLAVLTPLRCKGYLAAERLASNTSYSNLAICIQYHPPGTCFKNLVALDGH